jgi:AcrR family transcriptional regulator
MPEQRRKRRPEQLPPGRHGLGRREVARSQRTRILDAVVSVVAEQGYPDARVTDLIARAGVSRKTFYEHFADKEECFLAAYDQTLAELLGATTEGFEVGDEWPDRVREGLIAFLGVLANNPDAARVCIVEVLAAGPKAVARRDAAIRGFTHFIDAGRLQAPRGIPTFTAIGVLGGINEVLYAEIRRGATRDLPRLMPDLLYLVLLPFVGHEAAQEERRLADEMQREEAVAAREARTQVS